MIKKGIILAGGMGTRMSPLTKAVNKQLLPIYDKPLIFYPLSILMLSKIKDILIIVNKGQLEQYKRLIPNGKNLGIKITYIEQDKPRGLPDAFILGKDFIKNGNLGPNGSFPINTNGGGLSYCHPGMYSIFTMIEGCRQLWGECGERQLKKNINNVLCHGTGGVLSSAATTILSKEAK